MELMALRRSTNSKVRALGFVVCCSRGKLTFVDSSIPTFEDHRILRLYQAQQKYQVVQTDRMVLVLTVRTRDEGIASVVEVEVALEVVRNNIRLVCVYALDNSMAESPVVRHSHHRNHLLETSAVVEVVDEL